MRSIRVGYEREKGIQEGRFMDVQALRNKGHEQDQLKDLRQERKRSKKALQQVSVKMDSMEKQMNELAKLLEKAVQQQEGKGGLRSEYQMLGNPW